jgi:hypothetical protein
MRNNEPGRRQRQEPQSREERGRYSPDWSQQDAEPRFSDEPYYARNRNREGGREDESSRERSRYGQSDEGRMTRASQRNERGTDDEGSYYRGYYSQGSQPFDYPGGSGNLYFESWTLTGPYTGRGPKGYQRSSQQLIDEASQRLERDGEIDASDIEVTCENGVITLRGTVPERAMKRRAEQCVESVYGTRDVMNELRVAPQSEGESGSRNERTAQQSGGDDKKSQKR